MAYSHHPPTTTTTTYHHYRSPSRPSRSESHPRFASTGPIPVCESDVAEETWIEMGHTYVWMAEQDFIRGHKRSMKTEDWVREQQKHFVLESARRPPPPSATPSPWSSPPQSSPMGRRRTTSRPMRLHNNDWEEVLYIYEIDADDLEWARQEERAKRMALERERARVRIQEEVKRIEAKFEHKRQAERRAREESRRRGLSELRERERRERARVDRAVVDAWARYEGAWGSLVSGGTEELSFESIPWPLVGRPRSVEDITQEAIAAFLLSPSHSSGMSRKERLKSALLRWHPDRFRRVLRRVGDGDRVVVEEGVGVVARCLNILMEKEKSK